MLKSVLLSARPYAYYVRALLPIALLILYSGWIRYGAVAHAAATWVVTTTGDDAAGKPCSGTCTTLRDALSTAADGDSIDLSGLTGTISVGIHGTLLVNHSVTISGPGASTLSINGQYSVGVLSVANGATVTISGLTIQNGYTSNYGGGIENFGTLTVTDCTLTGNEAKVGGGISSHNGATLTVLNSTFSANTADGFGGGGLYSGVGSILTVSNSTFNGNKTSSSTGIGGAIYNDASGAATLSNSTIAGNKAGYLNGGNGGGIANYGTFTIYSDIIYHNTAFSKPDIYSGLNTTVSSAGFNLLANSVSVATQPSDQFGLDPQLGTLTNNGGTTQTMAITMSSPAYQKGQCSSVNSAPAVVYDQRGVGYQRKATCDVGAYEVVAILPTTSAPTATATSAATTIATATATSAVTSAATAIPTSAATASPTAAATSAATASPTAAATSAATISATAAATSAATASPTAAATSAVTASPISAATVTVQPTTSTAVPSSANAANQNAAPSNRSAADPQISADLNPALVLPGDTVTLTILITNQGETTAQNVVVRAVMPSAWSLLALNTTQGSYSLVDQTAQIVPVRYVRQSRSQAINQKTLIVRIGSMLPGQQVHISAQIQVAASASAGATIVDDLTLSADGLPVIRTALASMRVTAGALPFTGERPDRAADHSGLLFALLVAMASGIVLFSRRRAA